MRLNNAVLSALPLIGSAFGSPTPLTTTASTVTTLQGPEPGKHSMLVHVLRTEDLIADKMDKKPLLLEKLSHLLIKIELGGESVAVNGHSLPLLPGEGKDPLQVSVKLNQVQMLKLPKDSPLVPLRLSPTELVKISDKYMSEGIVAAMLSVKQEPLTVQATTEDGKSVEAKAYKVTIGIKILEVDGLSLAETNLPAVDLLHLIVHPDPENPSKIAKITTLAPEALIDPAPARGSLADAFASGSMLGSALDGTRASLDSALGVLSGALGKLAAHASHMLHGHRLHRPCHGRKRPHFPVHHHADPKPAVVAAAETAPTTTHPVGHHAHAPTKLACLIKMAARSSIAVLLFGLPLLLVSLVFGSIISSLIRRHREANAEEPLVSYEAVMAEEKLSDEEMVVLLSTKS